MKIMHYNKTEAKKPVSKEWESCIYDKRAVKITTGTIGS